MNVWQEQTIHLRLFELVLKLLWRKLQWYPKCSFSVWSIPLRQGRGNFGSVAQLRLRIVSNVTTYRFNHLQQLIAVTKLKIQFKSHLLLVREKWYAHSGVRHLLVEKYSYTPCLWVWKEIEKCGGNFHLISYVKNDFMCLKEENIICLSFVVPCQRCRRIHWGASTPTRCCEWFLLFERNLISICSTMLEGWGEHVSLLKGWFLK